MAGAGAAGTAEAGVRIGTLSDAVSAGLVGDAVELPPALGVPARTGKCGPATRWPTWFNSTPK